VPDEVVEGLGGAVEAVGGEGAVHVRHHAVRAGEDPAVHQGEVGLLPPTGRGGSSSLRSTKRVAFHSLLAKARYPSMRSWARGMSFPGPPSPPW
jgi:hypothetical protein